MQRQYGLTRASWRRVLSVQQRWTLHGAGASFSPSPRARGCFSSASFAAGKCGAAAASCLQLSPSGWRHSQALRCLSTETRAPSGRASGNIAAAARMDRAHATTDVAALLPMNRSNAFYDRKMREALDRSDLQLAMDMLERLRKIEPGRPVLLGNTYNQLLYLHGQQQQQQQQQQPQSQRRRKRDPHLIQILDILDEMILLKRVSSRSFNTALAACSRARDVQKARLVLDQMVAAHKTPGVFSYTAAIQCCARKRGDVEAAEGLFEQMVEDGLEPSVEAVRAMLSVYSRGRGRSDRMLALCSRAREYFDLPLDRASVDIVVRYLLQSGERSHAVEFLRDAVKDSQGATTEGIGARTWDMVRASCYQQNDQDLGEQVERLESEFRMSSKSNVRVGRPKGGVAPKQPSQQDEKKASAIPQAGDPELWKLRLVRLLALKDLEGAALLLEKMIRHKVVDAESLDAILAECSRSDNLELAEDVLRSVKRSGLGSALRPSVVGYNAILNCCAMRGDFEKAERFFQELYGCGIEPDLVTLNTMLKALATSCDHEDDRHGYLMRSLQAMALYDWATNDLGLKPSAITHFTLLQVFAHDASRDNDNGISAASEQTHEQIVYFIERIFQEAPLSALDVGVFNAAIDYFLRVGDTDRARSMLGVMISRGVSVDDGTFGLIFAAATSVGDSEMGLSFLHYAMNSYNYQPTVQVMNGAIELCAATHNPGGASELFNSMEASEFLLPDAQSYVQVIRAFARVGNVTEAWSVASAMKDQLGQCSLDAYNRVLQACAVSGQSERALDVLAQMTQREELTPDVVTFDMVLKALVKASAAHAKRHAGTNSEHAKTDPDVDEEWADEGYAVDQSEIQATRVRDTVLSLLGEMHRYGVAPSSLTYSRAISACALRGDTDGVRMVFDDLAATWERSTAKSAAAPSLLSDVALSEYIKACRTSEDAQRLLRLTRLLGDEFKRSDGHAAASSRVLLELMNAFESVGLWRQALALLRGMDTAFGVNPSVALFNRAMEMCNAAGEHESVQLIFLTMQNAPAYLVDPNVGSYIQAIYAAEQLEEWTRATNLFLAMQHNCPKEEIRPADLHKIALGRYSERSRVDDGDRGDTRS